MTNELKKALLNESWTPFGKMPKEVQEKFLEIAREGECIEILDYAGTWSEIATSHLHNGRVYRIRFFAMENSSTTYTDLIPVTHNGNLCVIMDNIHVPISHLRIGWGNCIGFVYDGKVCPSMRIKPIDKSDPPTGFTIDPPQAVRFRK